MTKKTCIRNVWMPKSTTSQTREGFLILELHAWRPGGHEVKVTGVKHDSQQHHHRTEAVEGVIARLLIDESSIGSGPP